MIYIYRDSKTTEFNRQVTNRNATNQHGGFTLRFYALRDLQAFALVRRRSRAL